MIFPKKVSIVEVGPRDGLQNEPRFIPTSIKVAFIKKLIASGLTQIEIGSFVSSKKIPQLQDSEAVFKQLPNNQNLSLSALVPNEQGMEQALRLGLKSIAIFTAASETFNAHNIHCSIKESLARFKPVLKLAKAHEIYVKAYLSTAFNCPYEGKIAKQRVVTLSHDLYALECDEICLADTTGQATPKDVEGLLVTIMKDIKKEALSLHFHDTYGQALVNVFSALQLGITRFDSATSGLGGCPYAQGATGNVATEDLLYLLQGLGIETNISLDKVIKAGQFLCETANLTNHSRAARAILATLQASKESR